MRFSKIVEKIGKPEPYTLWLPPEKDSRLKAALKGHRVMTLHQESTGHATDFGEVGFEQGAQGSFLLFPKSLKRFEGKRVVGIKYDLLQEPPDAPAREPKKAAKPKSPPKRSSKAAAKPKLARKASRPDPSAPRERKFEPLRVFHPEEEDKPPKRAKPPKRVAPAPKQKQPQLDQLILEVGKAMKKLEQGNAVAAYQLLERALRPD